MGVTNLFITQGISVPRQISNPIGVMDLGCAAEPVCAAD